MSRHQAVSRADHRQFCLNEGWTEVRSATGGRVRHHETYELALSDGRVLRTHISRPPSSRATYGAGLWAEIRRQLDVTDDEFWACVQARQRPARSIPAPTATPLPASLLAQLLAHGVPADDAYAMTLEQAVSTMNAIWGQPPHTPFR